MPPQPPRSPGATPSASSTKQTSICMIMMRWGGWPSWIALTIRTLQLNPTITFHIVGDQKPGTFGWPDNCRFHKLTVRDVMKRAQQVLGASPGSLEIAGTSSKISDFKPMLAALYPEMVEGCGFWGYMQEDQFIGSMRSFLDEPMLAAFDTISPLPQPMYNAGPFMLYRRSKQVDALYRRSAEWRRVVRDPSYMVFDEWWGPRVGVGRKWPCGGAVPRWLARAAHQ